MQIQVGKRYKIKEEYLEEYNRGMDGSITHVKIIDKANGGYIGTPGSINSRISKLEILVKPEHLEEEIEHESDGEDFYVEKVCKNHKMCTGDASANYGAWKNAKVTRTAPNNCDMLDLTKVEGKEYAGAFVLGDRAVKPPAEDFDYTNPTGKGVFGDIPERTVEEEVNKRLEYNSHDLGELGKFIRLGYAKGIFKEELTKAENRGYKIGYDRGKHRSPSPPKETR